MPYHYNESDFTPPTIQKQKFSKWCWAACTIFICNWFKTYPQLSQPKLVADILELPLCASGYHPIRCNQSYDLGSALQKVGHLADAPVNNPLTVAEVEQFFTQHHRPLGCQIFYPDTGGHAVVITGMRLDNNGKLFLSIADPADGALLTMSYETARNNFRGQGGNWIRSYYTKPLTQS